MLLNQYIDAVFARIHKLSPRTVFLTLIFLFILVVTTNGIEPTPKHYQGLSQNPFVDSVDIVDYWQESVLLPLIAYYTQMNSKTSFYILCLLIYVISWLIFAKLTLNRFGVAPALIFTSVLITSPLTTTTLSWLGSVDSLTFALTMPFIFTHSKLLILILSILGPMNHIVFIIATGEILVLRLISRNKIVTDHLITAIAGYIVGFGLLKLFLASNQFHISESRLDYILNNIEFWIYMNTAPSHYTSFLSLFSIQWLVIIICMLMFYRIDRVYYSLLITLLILNMGITFFTADTTRVFSLLSWGVLVECMFYSYRLALTQEDKNFQKQYLVSLFIIGLISLLVPRYYSFLGSIYHPPYFQFAVDVANSRVSLTWIAAVFFIFSVGVLSLLKVKMKLVWFYSISYFLLTAGISLSLVFYSPSYFRSVAARLPSEVGRNNDGIKEAVEGERGFLSFGPYINLKSGDYVAVFTYKSQPSYETIIGWVDVTTDKGQDVIVKKEVYGTEDVLSRIEIPFSLQEDEKDVEVRFWYEGTGSVSLHMLEIRQQK